MIQLSTVEAVFQLSGRPSVVVAPGVPRSGSFGRVQIGDTLMLKRPDGSTLETTVGGFEMLSPPNPTCIPLMLGPGVTTDMVPVGTSIWVRRNQNQ